jgi:predicted small secreted protein
MNKLILVAALFALPGCNTIEGFGRDLQSVGGVLTGTAQGAQNSANPPASPNRSSSCQPDAEGNVLDGCPRQ